MTTTAKMVSGATFIVREILDGRWASEPPLWASRVRFVTPVIGNWASIEEYDYTRAVQTAEAFCVLFAEMVPEFDETRFLRACGLIDKDSI